MGKKILVYFLFTLGCGSVETGESVAKSPIYLKFGLSSEEDDGTIGYCNIYFGAPRGKIYIDKTWWENTSTAADRYIIVKHERGHCDYGIMEHTSGEFDDLCPHSIMNAVIPDRFCYHKHRDHYEAEYRMQTILWGAQLNGTL